MNYKTESEFLKHIKAEPLHRVYLFYGSEAYLISLYAKKVRGKAFTGQFEQFNLQEFDGGRMDVRSVSDAIEGLPFMSDRKCVILDDVDVGGLSMGEVDNLSALLSDPPATTTVIITAKTYTFSDAKAKKLIKAAQTGGCTLKLAPRTRVDTAKFIRERAEKSGAALSTEQAYYLLERCSDDMNLLSSEVEKLCAYAGGEPVTKQHIDAVTCPVVQASVFDLSKSILRRDYDAAIHKLDELMTLREEPVVILAVLSSAFLDLYRAKAGSAASLSSQRVAEAFDVYKGKEWRINNALRDASRYSADSLRKTLTVLLEADHMLKSVRCEGRIVLEQTITKLFLILQG